MIQHVYSRAVEPSQYITEGLCNGISLRMHRDVNKERSGILQAQADWNRWVYPVKDYHGGMAAEYSFICVTVPECLPERLEVISYANEYAFLYDDAMEQIESKQHDQITARLVDIFRDGSTGETLNTIEAGAKKIKEQIFTRMLEIDPARARTSIKAWSTFIQAASSRDRTEPFASLDDYLPYRIIDAGEMIWFGTVTFGMALTIPETEMEKCRQLSWPAFAAISLTNDLYSWDKEFAAAQKDGMPHVVNAIWVLMRQFAISASRAQEICRQKIAEFVDEYTNSLKRIESDSSLNVDLKKYVTALQYSLSGNLVWSINCPRYSYGSEVGKQGDQ